MQWVVGPNPKQYGNDRPGIRHCWAKNLLRQSGGGQTLRPTQRIICGIAEFCFLFDLVDLVFVDSFTNLFQVPVITVKVEGQERLQDELKSYKWKQGDFLLATYPKNGKYYWWLLSGLGDYGAAYRKFTKPKPAGLTPWNSEGRFCQGQLLSCRVTTDSAWNVRLHDWAEVSQSKPWSICF